MLDIDPPIKVETRIMHVILKKDNPTLDNALPLGGGLTLFGDELIAGVWRDSHLTQEKREGYRIDEVKISHRIVPEKNDGES